MPIGPFRTYSQPVNLRDLDRVFDDGDEVNLEAEGEKGLLKNTKADVKMLGNGELKKKLTVTAHAFSASAREKIEAAGGSATALKEPKVRARRSTRPRKPQAERAARPRPPRPTSAEPPSRGRPSPRRPPRRRRLFSWLANAWRVPELRRRVLFTALILALYRLGSWMPAPGVDSETIKNYFNGQGGTILGLLNLFSGGALSQFSLFALGIMPYVTASIILQLMTVVIPTARAAAEGRRVGLRQDQPVHALPHGRCSRRRRRPATRSSSGARACSTRTSAGSR